MFVLIDQFQPSVIFVGNAIRQKSNKGLSLGKFIVSREEVTDREKHTRLLHQGINYKPIKIYSTGPRCQSYK